LAGVGLNIALGLGGLVSFGHAAFFGLGGYAVGILASHHADLRTADDIAVPHRTARNQMLVLWLVAIIVSGLAALVIGALSLRTSGVYFIMITLAFAQMIYYFAMSWPAYGGEDGLSIYVRNAFPGLNTLRPLDFFLLCYAVLIVVLPRVEDDRSRASAWRCRQSARTRAASQRSASRPTGSSSRPS
jgi:branched-chain amino acid transport system permease protein